MAAAYFPYCLILSDTMGGNMEFKVVVALCMLEFTLEIREKSGYHKQWD